MAAKRYPRTHCVQLHVNKITDAAHHFQHFSIEEKPIVIVPDTPKCLGILFFTCCLTVPDGMWVIYQRCGRDEGGRKPGFICCWPGWYRISHVVTKQVSALISPARVPPLPPPPPLAATARRARPTRQLSVRPAVKAHDIPRICPRPTSAPALRTSPLTSLTFACTTAPPRPYRTRIPCATARRATTLWWRWTCP